MEKYADSKFESKGKGRSEGVGKKGPNKELDLRTLEEISDTEDQENLEHGRFIPIEEIAGDNDWEKYGEDPEEVPEYFGEEIRVDDPKQYSADKLHQMIEDAYETEKEDYDSPDLTEDERQELVRASIAKMMGKLEEKGKQDEILRKLEDEPVLPKIKEAPKSKKEKVWNPSEEDIRKHLKRKFERFIEKKNPDSYQALQNYKEPITGDNPDTGTYPDNIWKRWLGRFNRNSKKNIDPNKINNFLDRQQENNQNE